MIKNECIICNPKNNCLECDSDLENRCTKCAEGRYLEKGDCKLCSSAS
jgi:hypothetical protein